MLSNMDAPGAIIGYRRRAFRRRVGALSDRKNNSPGAAPFRAAQAVLRRTAQARDRLRHRYTQRRDPLRCFRATSGDAIGTRRCVISQPHRKKENARARRAFWKADGGAGYSVVVALDQLGIVVR